MVPVAIESLRSLSDTEDTDGRETGEGGVPAETPEQQGDVRRLDHQPRAASGFRFLTAFEMT